MSRYTMSHIRYTMSHLSITTQYPQAGEQTIRVYILVPEEQVYLDKSL